MAKWLVTNTQNEGGYVYYDLKKDGNTLLTKKLLTTIKQRVNAGIKPGDTYQEPGFPEISYEAYQAAQEELREADERYRQQHR